MHELGLMNDLLRKIESIAATSGATKITRVRVRFGALSPVSPSHFREHFYLAIKGTVAEGAELDIEASGDPSDPHSQEIFIDSVDVEEPTA